MASGKDVDINKAKSFIDLLKKNGIDVSEAYLFGSVRSGVADEDSDIDIAVVSRDFEGVPYYETTAISISLLFQEILRGCLIMILKRLADIEG